MSYFISNIASISTAIPSGKELALIATLACLPELPKIPANTSEAGLRTLGWSIKSSVEFT